MERHEWDTRYAGEELVWSSTPNQFLVAEVQGLRPGKALDLGCGEGRNALWLAEQGWTVTGVDFSTVGLAKAARLAEAGGVNVDWVQSDVLTWRPPAEGFDLVAVFYLQLAPSDRTEALRAMARTWVAWFSCFLRWAKRTGCWRSSTSKTDRSKPGRRVHPAPDVEGMVPRFLNPDS